MDPIPGDTIYYVAFREDNTEGYSQEQRDDLNAELARRLWRFRPGSSEWWETAKSFAHEVSRR